MSAHFNTSSEISNHLEPGNPVQSNPVAQENRDNSLSLHEAVRAGNVDIVRELIALGVSVNARDKDRMTPLHCAAIPGSQLNLQNETMTPLHYAARQGEVTITRLLINAKALTTNIDNIGMTPLHHAAQRGHVEIVNLLVAAKALTYSQDALGMTPLHYAVKENHIAIVAALCPHASLINIQDKEGLTPFHYAMEPGKADFIRIFIRAKANLHIPANDGDTPLSRLKHLLSRRHSSYPFGLALPLDVIQEIFVELLKTKDSVAVKGVINTVGLSNQEVIYFSSKKGKTLLHWAIVHGDVEAVILLIRYGSNINAADEDGLTPLHFAIASGEVQVVELLVQLGGDINAANKEGLTPLDYAKHNLNLTMLKKTLYFRDKEGRTPLHVAALSSNIQSVEELLRCGSDVNVVDSQGLTPLHYAIRNGNAAIVEKLVDANADINIQTKKGLTVLEYAFSIKAGMEDIQFLKSQEKLIQLLRASHQKWLEGYIKKCVHFQKRIDQRDRYFYITIVDRKLISYFKYISMVEPSQARIEQGKVSIELRGGKPIVTIPIDANALDVDGIMAFFASERLEQIDKTITDRLKKAITAFDSENSSYTITYEPYTPPKSRNKYNKKSQKNISAEKLRFEIVCTFAKKEVRKAVIQRLQLVFPLAQKNGDFGISFICDVDIILNEVLFGQERNNWQKTIEAKEKARLQAEEKRLEKQKQQEELKHLSQKEAQEKEDARAKKEAELRQQILAERRMRLKKEQDEANKGKAKHKAQKRVSRAHRVLQPLDPSSESKKSQKPLPKEQNLSRPILKSIEEGFTPPPPPSRKEALPTQSMPATEFSFFSSLSPAHSLIDLQPTSKLQGKKKISPVKVSASSYSGWCLKDDYLYLSSLLACYEKNRGNSSHIIRAMYYRVIRTLVNRNADQNSELWTLRNFLVHDFCTESWDTNENKRSFLVRLVQSITDGLQPTPIIPGSIMRKNDRSLEDLCQKINKELSILSELFAIKSKQGMTCQIFFLDLDPARKASCYTALLIIAECCEQIRLLGYQSMSEKDLLNQLRKAFRNIIVHEEGKLAELANLGVAEHVVDDGAVYKLCQHFRQRKEFLPIEFMKVSKSKEEKSCERKFCSMQRHH